MGLIQLGYLAGRNAAGVEGLGWDVCLPIWMQSAVFSHDDVRGWIVNEELDVGPGDLNSPR